MLELGKRRATVFVDELGQFGMVARASVLVDRDAACDRECPRAEMLTVAQVGIRAQGAQERLLECVFRALPAKPAYEERVDLVAVQLVEALERRQAHVDIF